MIPVTTFHAFSYTFKFSGAKHYESELKKACLTFVSTRSGVYSTSASI